MALVHMKAPADREKKHSHGLRDALTLFDQARQAGMFATMLDYLRHFSAGGVMGTMVLVLVSMYIVPVSFPMMVFGSFAAALTAVVAAAIFLPPR